MEKETYTAMEIKDILGCGLNKAREIMNSNQFRVINIGRRKVVSKKVFEDWMNKSEVENGERTYKI